MITLVEPKEYIDKLWGNQNYVEDGMYRLMRYVIRMDLDGVVLLHNVITGQLIILEKREMQALKNSPFSLSEELMDLVSAHFLVPINFDEHLFVVSIRSILRKIDSSRQTNYITTYTILPTTNCNARCYYCFEKGARRELMTEETANAVVEFIARHYDRNRDVYLSWFGGEPTLAADRISQICRGLRAGDIYYKSDITTNGYLFRERMVEESVDLWNLRSVMISFDGTESSYNRIKRFSAKGISPYKRVMENIKLLLEKQINVHVRMNFDIGNYHEFQDLIQDFSDCFKNSMFLNVTVHPINGKHLDEDGSLLHGSSDWFDKIVPLLHDISRKKGFLQISDQLPCLRFKNCEAASETAVTITPRGMLVSCPEQFGDDEIKGDIYNGITNQKLVRSWKAIADYPKCAKCLLFPYCIRFEKCNVKERCEFRSELIVTTKLAVMQHYENWRNIDRSKRRI